jgi:hypothetical protein
MSKFFKNIISAHTPMFQTCAFLVCFFSGTIYADTQKTQEQIAGAIWQSAIQIYIKSEGVLPKNWEDLMRVEGSDYYVKSLDKDINDFRKHYRFLSANERLIINVNGREKRIIGMGITTRNPGPNTVFSKDVRSVILMTNDNQIEHATLTESELKISLEKAGVDLKDYTGSNGKWEPEPKINRNEENEIKNGDDTDFDNSSSSQSNNEQKVQVVDVTRDGFGKYTKLVSLGIALLIVALLIFITFLKSRK